MFDGNPFDAACAGNMRAMDVWGREVHTTENLIAYRDFFVRKMRQTPGVRFINASEGGILLEGAEVISLKDALAQCRRTAHSANIARVLQSCYQPSQVSYAALDHLADVLRGGRRDCDCLTAFLELTAKESVLKGDQAGIERAILWGKNCCEGLHRSDAKV